jgi:hypothetical protein
MKMLHSTSKASSERQAIPLSGHGKMLPGFQQQDPGDTDALRKDNAVRKTYTASRLRGGLGKGGVQPPNPYCNRLTVNQSIREGEYFCEDIGYRRGGVHR